MAYVGTQSWAAITGGRIRIRDRAELIRLAAITGFIDLPRYVAYRVVPSGNSSAPGGFFGSSALPTTPAATQALAQLSAIAPSFVVNHSIRTYWFSRLIGESLDVPVDDELLYVASLAHDIGLYAPAPFRWQPQCFSIRGAAWAAGIAANTGWSAERTNRLGEAITLNLNGRVARKRGLEASLLMRGVLADVTGLHAWNVKRTTIQALFHQIPRDDQRTKLPLVFGTEADRFPDCRAHFALRWLFFKPLMRHPPKAWT